MDNTVRQRLLEAVRTAIAGMAGVGLVLDAAARLDGEPLPEISAALADKKHVVELVVLDDEKDEAHDAVDVEAFSFVVAAIVHLPDDLEGKNPADAASSIYADLYVLCTADRSWGGLGLDTRPEGGGGVAISDIGTRETAAAFRIFYRHTAGNPTEAR